LSHIFFIGGKLDDKRALILARVPARSCVCVCEYGDTMMMMIMIMMMMMMIIIV